MVACNVYDVQGGVDSNFATALQVLSTIQLLRFSPRRLQRSRGHFITYILQQMTFRLLCELLEFEIDSCDNAVRHAFPAHDINGINNMVFKAFTIMMTE
jgi:hypothetical protein